MPSSAFASPVASSPAVVLSELPASENTADTANCLQEAAAWLQVRTEEINDWNLVDHVLSRIEGRAIQRVDPDTVMLRLAARQFRQALETANLILLSESYQKLERELHLWLTALIERDSRVQVSHLRRSCAANKNENDLHVYAALARFYRTIPHNAQVQRKYDFAVTGLFCEYTDDHHRVLRVEHTEMVDYLRHLVTMWNQSTVPSSQRNDEIRRALMLFNAFVEEIRQITEFEDLMEKDLLRLIRAYKGELGEVFYEPEVTAAAIECNLIAGNKFATLLESDIRNIVDSEEFRSGLETSFPEALTKSMTEEELLLKSFSKASELSRTRSGRTLRADSAEIIAAPPPVFPVQSVAASRATGETMSSLIDDISSW